MHAFAALLAITLPALPVARRSRQDQLGTIKDAQGGVLPGVTVDAKNQATGAVQSTVSNESDPSLSALAPGRA